MGHRTAAVREGQQIGRSETLQLSIYFSPLLCLIDAPPRQYDPVLLVGILNEPGAIESSPSGSRPAKLVGASHCRCRRRDDRVGQAGGPGLSRHRGGWQALVAAGRNGDRTRYRARPCRRRTAAQMKGQPHPELETVTPAERQLTPSALDTDGQECRGKDIVPRPQTRSPSRWRGRSMFASRGRRSGPLRGRDPVRPSETGQVGTHPGMPPLLPTALKRSP